MTSCILIKFTGNKKLCSFLCSFIFWNKTNIWQRSQHLKGQWSSCTMCAREGDGLKYHFYISIYHLWFGFFVRATGEQAGVTRQGMPRSTAQPHARADKLAVDIFHSVHLYILHTKNAWGALVMNTSTFTLLCKNSYKEMISVLQRGYTD